MNTRQLKEDLDLMIEASRRVWHVDLFKEIRKIIDKEEPIMINMEHPEDKIYYCPVCNKGLLYEEYDRCWECGQALKWF